MLDLEIASNVEFSCKAVNAFFQIQYEYFEDDWIVDFALAKILVFFQVAIDDDVRCVLSCHYADFVVGSQILLIEMQQREFLVANQMFSQACPGQAIQFVGEYGHRWEAGIGVAIGQRWLLQSYKHSKLISRL